METGTGEGVSCMRHVLVCGELSLARMRREGPVNTPRHNPPPLLTRPRPYGTLDNVGWGESGQNSANGERAGNRAGET